VLCIFKNVYRAGKLSLCPKLFFTSDRQVRAEQGHWIRIWRKLTLGAATM
jgi:hypothetical protein